MWEGRGVSKNPDQEGEEDGVALGGHAYNECGRGRALDEGLRIWEERKDRMGRTGEEGLTTINWEDANSCFSCRVVAFRVVKGA